MPKSREKPKKILVNVDDCKECLNCMYVCSMNATGRFSLVGSRIKVVPGELPYEDSSRRRTITFSEACEHCYRCVNACSHDALWIER